MSSKEIAFTCVVDSREKKPLDLSPLDCITSALPVGDYSIVTLEGVVAIERKSLADLTSCMGVDRERYYNQIARLKKLKACAIMIECDFKQIFAHRYRSKIHPNSVIGTIISHTLDGIPVLMAGNPEQAAQLAVRFLQQAARRFLVDKLAV